jgi:cell division protein ZapA
MNDQVKQTVSLQVAGRTVRVATTASEAEIRRLAAVVEGRTQEVSRGRGGTADAMVLTAISLAHDAERMRGEHAAFRADVLRRMKELLGQVDVALSVLAREGGGGGQEKQ